MLQEPGPEVTKTCFKTLTKTCFNTQGRFRVVDRLAVSTSAIDEDFDPMAFAAALEDKSSHPVASAVVSGRCS